MNRFTLLAAAFIATAVCGLPVRGAQAFDVLLDVSGSMKGFLEAPGSAFSQTLTELLSQSAATGGKSFKFGDRFRRLDGSIGADGFKDRSTLLKDGLAGWLNTEPSPGQPLVVVTDNVASDKSKPEEVLAQREFYAILGRFGFIGMVNARLPFSGTVSTPDDSANAQYTGRRALAFYILALATPGSERKRSDDYRDAYRSVEAIKRLLEKRQVEFRELPLLPHDEGWSARSVEKPLIIKNPDAGGGPDVAVEPDGLHVRDFHLGDDLTFSFGTEVRPAGTLVLKDVEIKARIEFSETSAFLPDGAKIPPDLDVTPRITTLSPDPVTGTQRFTIKVDIRQFGYIDLPFATKLALAMRPSVPAQGTITLRYLISSKKNVEIFPPSIGDWSYDGRPENLGRSPTDGKRRPDDPRIHEKIFHLRELADRMLPAPYFERREEELHVIPVTLELVFPAGPIISLVLIGLVLGGSLLWLLSRAMSGMSFVVEDELGQEQAVIEAAIGRSYVVSSSDNCATVRLFALGPMFFVSTPNRLRSARLMFGPGPIKLQATQDDLALDYSFQLKRLEQSSNSIHDQEWGTET
ncbi:MAG: hypothetical protein ACLGJC_14100 [Alphaproteobacteria bacterium]